MHHMSLQAYKTPGVVHQYSSDDIPIQIALVHIADMNHEPRGIIQFFKVNLKTTDSTC